MDFTDTSYSWKYNANWTEPGLKEREYHIRMRNFFDKDLEFSLVCSGATINAYSALGQDI